LGLDQVEVERRFTPAWALLSATDEPVATATEPDGHQRRIAKLRNRFSAGCYLLQWQS
jgi:hypothetical protein